MAKGRKPVYQSEDEKPVMLSLRVPRDVYEQVEQYVKMHPRMTLTEFILDGIRLRLETPADPRDIILSDDNTVIRELQEMIRAEVQAEIGKLNNFMESARDALKRAPTLPEAAAEVIPVSGYEVTPGHSVVTEDVSAPAAAAEPVPEVLYDDNTVLRERPSRAHGRPRGAMRQSILTLLSVHPEGLSAEQIRGYLSPEKPIGDTLQGMRRQHVVRTQGSGKEMQYFIA